MSDIKLVGCEKLEIKPAQVIELEKVDDNNEASGFLQKSSEKDKYAVVVDQDKLKSDTKYAEAYKRFSDKYLEIFPSASKDQCSVEVEKNAKPAVAGPTPPTPPTVVTKSTTRETYVKGGITVTVASGNVDSDEMGVKDGMSSVNLDLGGRFAVSIPLTEDGNLRIDPYLEVKYAGEFGKKVSAEDAFGKEAVETKKPEKPVEGAPAVPAATIPNDDGTKGTKEVKPSDYGYKGESFQTTNHGVKIVLGADMVYIFGKDGVGIGISLGGYGYGEWGTMGDTIAPTTFNAWHVYANNGSYSTFGGGLRVGPRFNTKYVDIGVNLDVSGGKRTLEYTIPNSEIPTKQESKQNVFAIGGNLTADFHGARTVEPVVTAKLPEDPKCPDADDKAQQADAKAMRAAMFDAAGKITPEWRKNLEDMGMPKELIDTMEVKVKLVPVFGGTEKGKEGRVPVGSEIRAVFVVNSYGREFDLMDRTGLSAAAGKLEYVSVAKLTEWDKQNKLKKLANDGKADIKKAFDSNPQAQYSTGRPTAKELAILASITDKATFEKALTVGYRSGSDVIKPGLVSNFAAAQSSVVKVSAEINKYKDALKGTEIKFHGTTDTRGGTTANQDLSDRRAKLLAIWYEKNDAKGIKGYGTGETPPLPCDEKGRRGADLKQCQQQNRATSIEFGDDGAGVSVHTPGHAPSEVRVMPIDLQKNMALSESIVEKTNKTGQTCSVVKVSAAIQTIGGSNVKPSTPNKPLDAPLLDNEKEDKAPYIEDPKPSGAPVSSDKSIDIPAQATKLKGNSEGYGKELEEIKKLPRTNAAEKELVNLKMRSLHTRLNVDLAATDRLISESKTPVADLDTAKKNLEKAKVDVKAYHDELAKPDKPVKPTVTTQKKCPEGQERKGGKCVDKATNPLDDGSAKAPYTNRSSRWQPIR